MCHRASSLLRERIIALLFHPAVSQESTLSCLCPSLPAGLPKNLLGEKFPRKADLQNLSRFQCHLKPVQDWFSRLLLKLKYKDFPISGNSPAHYSTHIRHFSTHFQEQVIAKGRFILCCHHQGQEIRNVSSHQTSTAALQVQCG